MSYRIRTLGAADADDYRRIRLEALRLHPEAYTAAYEDEAVLDRSQILERLSTPGIARFGAFASDDLVGLCGLRTERGAKLLHKAHLFSMYVRAAHRRTGLAQQLVEAVIKSAREAGALMLELTVTAGNLPAQRLYRRMGFIVYGVEPRAVRIGDRFHDEELMVLDLD